MSYDAPMLITIHLTPSDNLLCPWKKGMVGPCYKDDDKMKSIMTEL
jgi:hypothetical protein